MKILELFAGTRSIGKAFEAKGHEVYSIEWDKQHENIDWYMDISKITKEDILERFGQPDVIWASPDCFLEGTLVWTDKGYKPIEQIECNDMVLTHENRYRKVYRTIVKKTDKFNKVKISGSEEFLVTPEHPFYVRKKKKIWVNENRTNKIILEEPQWVKASELTNEYRVGIPINTKSEIPKWNGVVKVIKNQFGIEQRYIENNLSEYLENEDFWWIIGRYFGDGSYVFKPNYYRFEICCAKDEEEEIAPILDRLGFNYQLSEKQTTKVFNFGTKELVSFIDQFGKGSLNKEITSQILNLPKNLLKAFLDGYISADGHWEEIKNNRYCNITTVSEKLAYGIQQCLLKVYGRYGSLVVNNNPNNVIEGRIVNSHKSYNISFYEQANRQNYLIEDSMAWVNISKSEPVETEMTPIYNLSVEEDESYTVYNLAVHNCTSYSVAGISHHRRKNSETGSLEPISDYAKFCDDTNKHLIQLIKDLNPKYYFIENPRGGMRKMDFMQELPRYTVTYCQYGEERMKPTDLWTNHPDPKFKPPCKNGAPCHVAAPRGSQTGTQGIKGSVDRSRIPEELCEHIVDICEEGLEK